MADNEAPVMPFKASVGIGRQTDKGSAVAATLWFDFSEEDNRSETILHEPAGVAEWVSGVASRERGSTPTVPVKRDGRINFKCEPRWLHLFNALPWALGAPLGGTTYAPGTTDHWLTTETDKVAEEGGLSVERLADGKVTKLTLESAENGSLSMTLEGVAGAKTLIAGTAVDWSAWESKPPMMHHGLTILVAGRPDWVPPGMVYSLKVEIEAGVEEEHFGNNLTRIAAPTGYISVTGTLQIPWNDETAGLRTVMEDGTRFDLHPQWVGADDETFALQLSCKLIGEPVKLSGKEGVKCNLNFECVRSGATRAIQAVFGS